MRQLLRNAAHGIRPLLFLVLSGCLLAALLSGRHQQSVAAHADAARCDRTITPANQSFEAVGSNGDLTETLAIDDGTPEGGLGNGGTLYVNRLTPPSYPAKLQRVRIFFRKFDNLPNPAGALIRLVAFAGTAGTDRPADNAPLLLDQTVTIPAIAANGEFVDFPIVNGPTINAGDFYVGFQLPNLNVGVGAFFDLNSTDQRRSFFSVNDGEFYFGPLPPQQPGVTSVNLLVRAVVSLGNDAGGPVTSVSAASFTAGIASEGIVAAFGMKLATTVMAASGTLSCPTCLPTELAGTTVRLKDHTGVERLAPLFFVSPSQVNYFVPAGAAPGALTVTITSGDGTVSTGTAQLTTVAPGLFTANGDGQGVPAGLALRVNGNTQTYEAIAQYDSVQRRFTPRAFDLGTAAEKVILVLYGTGLRFHQGLSSINAKIGGVEVPVQYAGAQGPLTGLDQINLELPRSLSGRGEVDVILSVDGKLANTVKLSIR